MTFFKTVFLFKSLEMQTINHATNVLDPWVNGLRFYW